MVMVVDMLVHRHPIPIVDSMLNLVRAHLTQLGKVEEEWSLVVINQGVGVEVMVCVCFVVCHFSQTVVLFTFNFCCFPSYILNLLQIGGRGGSGGGALGGHGGSPGDQYDDTVDILPQVLRPGSGGGGGAGYDAGQGKGGAGGAGGASIKLHALEDITINGIITANGDDGGLGVFENGYTGK